MAAPARKPQKKAPSKLSKTRPSKSKAKPKAPPPKQQKTKAPAAPPKKKRPVYTEKELGIPALNMVTPVGVQKPRGRKKGKIFVDDQESMMTILAMVNADKEGQIESKMMKARQMEEIREARRKEQEVKQEAKKSKMEEVKDSVRRKRKRKHDDTESTPNIPQADGPPKKAKKRVSFT
ncbi:MAG: 60S ribosomal subunit assembly/export protein [Peltula sp. TS41687]|nr:MAG: 60S ribosomal subunit assembly/export protein [Peltula sp. TS41687]